MSVEGQPQGGKPLPSGKESHLFVELHPKWRGSSYRYDVTLGGMTIVTDSSDPEHDAARALLARGLTGKATMVDGNTGKARMRINIEQAAQWRCSEEDKGGLRLRKLRPDTDIESPASETGTPDTNTPVNDNVAVRSDIRSA